MKKAALLLAFLFLIASLTVFWILSHQAPSKTSLLLPKTTIGFIELPDIATTLQHWHGSALEKISREPQLQPLEKIAQEFFVNWTGLSWNPDIVQKIITLLTALQPGRFFIAMEPNKEAPSWVVGCQFFGLKESMEQAVTELNVFFDAFFGVGIQTTLDPQEHHGELLKQRNYEALALIMAFHDNWFFISNDVTALQTTLDFAARRRPANDSLSASELYQKNRTSLFSEADLFFYITHHPLLEKLSTLSALLKGTAHWEQAQALGSSLRCRENDVEEKLFFTGDFHTSEMISHEGLRFTEPTTLIYAEKINDWKTMFSTFKEFPFFPSVVTSWLNAANIDLALLGTLLKPEFFFTASWKKDALFPSACLLSPELDSSSISAWLTKTGSQLGTAVNSHEASMLSKTNSPLLLLPLVATSSFLKPVFGSFQQLFLMSTDASYVEQLYERAFSSTKPALTTTLQAAPGFDATLYQQANEAFFYVAIQELLTPLWHFLQPNFAQLTTSDIQLSSIENISAHLAPFLVAESHMETGFLIQTRGPCSGTPLYLIGKLFYTLFVSEQQMLVQPASEKTESTTSTSSNDDKNH